MGDAGAVANEASDAAGEWAGVDGVGGSAWEGEAGASGWVGEAEGEKASTVGDCSDWGGKGLEPCDSGDV